MNIYRWFVSFIMKVFFYNFDLLHRIVMYDEPNLTRTIEPTRKVLCPIMLEFQHLKTINPLKKIPRSATVESYIFQSEP